MSILDKVREQKERTQEQLSRGGGRSAARFWRPENGDNKVRVMPQWKDDLDGQFWREVAQHWNVADDQKGPVLCPKETPDLDGTCPVCELVQSLRADKSNTEAQRLAKDMRAKKTYFLNVVVEKDPVHTAQDVAEFKQNRPDADCPFKVGSPKIQIYACPLTIFDQILGIIHSSGQDITDLTNGRGIRINKIPNKDRLKTRYEVYPDLDASDTGYTDPVLPALDKVGFTLDRDGMLQLLDGGRAAEFVISAGLGTALPAPTPAPAAEDKEAESAPVSSSDLEEQMRQGLSS
jgi:hypothetical protein